MLFFGVDVIDLECGVSMYNEDEVCLNCWMCEVVERIIVVIDFSKFNCFSLYKIIDI